MGRGVTQGGSLSPTLFKIVVNAVVRLVMLEILGPQESHHWLRWFTGEHNIVLYADDDRIIGRNPIWVQRTLTTLVRMFESVVLHTNLGKTKSMV